MTRALIAGGTLATMFVLVAVVAGYRALERDAHPALPSPATPAAPAASETTRGFLYGRITTVDGVLFQGRLRFGIGEEAFWGDYFNGTKRANLWLAHVPPEARPTERRRVEFLGLKIVDHERPLEVRRQLMAPFGGIARIEARGREVRVTLKSGTAFDLDRFEASDFDDGVRVWDEGRGVVDLDSLRIRSIELLATPALSGVPARLRGTVRTRRGEFTGFLQWDREACVGSDELGGRTADGEIHLRFDAIRSITRRARDGALVTLLDGREIVLSDSREVGPGHRGIYVDDPRYGRVLVSWDAFERVDFTPGDSGPAYGDFPRGSALRGGVTRRAGGRLDGRLVFDLDESETTETLDAPSEGVDYTLPFGLVASIVLPEGEERVRVELHGGEVLRLEREGDLGPKNAGLLVFGDGSERPEYVPWADVERIDLAPPTATPR